MGFSIVPFLVAIVALFPGMLGHRAFRLKAITRSQAVILYAYSMVMLSWASGVGAIAYFGLLVSKDFQTWFPGLWVPLLPIVLVAAPLFFRSVRAAIAAVSRVTPTHWFAYFQSLRITALGTAIKTHLGLFPEVVEYLVGVPDLLFGFSALWVAAVLKRGGLSRKFWIAWNLVGFAIIVPIGCIVINLSLPGPFQMYPEPPTFLVAFEFPMSLAPTAVVPWLVVANLWAATQWKNNHKPKPES